MKKYTVTEKELELILVEITRSHSEEVIYHLKNGEAVGIEGFVKAMITSEILPANPP